MRFETINLNSQAELRTWLVRHCIPIETWGQNATKTVQNLWYEVQAGEVTLVDDPPLRIIRVVQVIVRQANCILIESGQLMHGQQRRQRSFPPSEKLKPNEDHVAGAIRCLQEELALEPEAISQVKVHLPPYTREMESVSYPGLHSRYIVHTVAAKVVGLPQDDFYTDEIPSNRTDPVSRHYWTWKPEDEVKLESFP